MLTITLTPSKTPFPPALRRSAFYRRSAALLGLTALTLGAFWLVSRPVERRLLGQQADAVQVTEQQANVAHLAQLRTRYGPATLEAAQASVPSAIDRGRFFAWLETTATAHGVTTQPNFTSQRDEEGERTPGQWTVAVDFLGPVSQLADTLKALETGLYSLTVTSLEFDTTDPQAGQLKLIVTLYGTAT